MLIKSFLPSHYCEVDYINKLLSSLKQELNDTYSIFLLHNDLASYYSSYRKALKNIKGTTNIAVHIGNEVKIDKRLYKYFDFIFRFYLPHECDNVRVFPLNIGYNSSGDNNINFKSSKKLIERSKDVFFIGNKNVRMDFYQAMLKLSNKYDIQFTDSFRSGICIDDYLHELSEAKICLVPHGTSPETFRYSEAFASGCIVVAEHINIWYYHNSPAYFVSNWQEVDDDFLKRILDSDINNKHEENRLYYEKYLSPEANAKYIIDVIRNFN